MTDFNPDRRVTYEESLAMAARQEFRAELSATIACYRNSLDDENVAEVLESYAKSLREI